MVEETDPGRDVDLLLDPVGVPGICIEVYRHIYFGFVGVAFDLCSSWFSHRLGYSGGGGGQDKDYAMINSASRLR